MQALNVQSLLPVLPLLAGSAWAMLVIVVEMFSSNRRFTGVAWMSMLGLAGVAALALQPGTPSVYADALANDSYSSFFTVLVSVLGIGAMALSVDYLPAAGINKGEYYPLTVFAVLGVVVMAAATDLIVMFVGLETMSMAVYVLAGILRNDLRSNEASLKYFLLGAFSTLPDEATMARMQAETWLTPTGAVIEYIEHMVQADYRADAAAITLPTLLLYGRAGNATLPTELGRWLQGQIKGSRLVELQASGHSPFWEEPARFNAELAAFVNA